jgi:hypothetical protein
MIKRTDPIIFILILVLGHSFFAEDLTGATAGVSFDIGFSPG